MCHKTKEIIWKGNTYNGEVILENINNNTILIRVKDFYDVTRNIDIEFIKSLLPDYNENIHYYGTDLFIISNNSIIEYNKEEEIRFENGDFNEWDNIKDDENSCRTHLIAECDGYEIHEIIPSVSFNYYVDKKILNEIIEKHFQNLTLETEKDYFVLKDGEPINGC